MWSEPSRFILYRAYKADPLHKIPERLFSLAKQSLEVDRRLKDITSNLGVRYISAYDVFCNENGCLVRLGDTAKEYSSVGQLKAPDPSRIMVFGKPHRRSDISLTTAARRSTKTVGLPKRGAEAKPNYAFRGRQGL